MRVSNPMRTPGIASETNGIWSNNNARRKRIETLKIRSPSGQRIFFRRVRIFGPFLRALRSPRRQTSYEKEVNVTRNR